MTYKRRQQLIIDEKLISSKNYRALTPRAQLTFFELVAFVGRYEEESETDFNLSSLLSLEFSDFKKVIEELKKVGFIEYVNSKVFFSESNLIKIHDTNKARRNSYERQKNKEAEDKKWDDSVNLTQEDKLEINNVEKSKIKQDRLAPEKMLEMYNKFASIELEVVKNGLRKVVKFKKKTKAITEDYLLLSDLSDALFNTLKKTLKREPTLKEVAALYGEYLQGLLSIDWFTGDKYEAARNFNYIHKKENVNKLFKQINEAKK